MHLLELPLVLSLVHDPMIATVLSRRCSDAMHRTRSSAEVRVDEREASTRSVTLMRHLARMLGGS
ncbi:hypothetical protein BG844_20095 [Couchioplanes caeruleus subsp. caeruleus]|uniref:Uncharacterized protein n=1 Tax=Couchioplanes caeruleus subsp. caeruleus TaxID=56427 RepID=A0A1K0FI77_9ACTN|nr:hypothetical protein BG844_20095 [Couchioplanes caeruleus subsp. caeruleus]